MSGNEQSAAELQGPTPEETLEFSGEYSVQIDTNRRLIIPAPWRPKTARQTHQVVLWPIGQGTHLVVLPRQRWLALRQKIDAMPLNAMEAESLRRALGLSSKPMDLDKVGRFTLSERMMVGAGLEKNQEALLVGGVTMFEIWHPQRYEEQRKIDLHVASLYAQKVEL